MNVGRLRASKMALVPLHAGSNQIEFSNRPIMHPTWTPSPFRRQRTFEADFPAKLFGRRSALDSHPFRKGGVGIQPALQIGLAGASTPTSTASEGNGGIATYKAMDILATDLAKHSSRSVKLRHISDGCRAGA